MHRRDILHHCARRETARSEVGRAGRSQDDGLLVGAATARLILYREIRDVREWLVGEVRQNAVDNRRPIGILRVENAGDPEIPYLEQPELNYRIGLT